MAQVQRMSRLMVKTLRDDPADAETLNHKLLVRAGYVRRTAAGIWSWLPLGKKVLENVARVVREEMDAMGGQEVLLPALLPKEPYEATGRWEEYGPELFRLGDRKGAEYLLGPTHEEIFTQLVKDQCSSYKDLPVILYQIQAKYRDEARPRAGILRGREFLMKDSYSFDTADEGLAQSYALHREAYIKIFNRLGLDHRIVSAVSGAMGGSASEEFLAPAPAGEDTFVDCPACDYAANTEAVTFVAPAVESVEHPAVEELDTPDTPTIESLAEYLGVPASATLKNLLVKADGEIVAVGVPGDREVDLGKLGEHLAPAVVELVTAEDFEGRDDLVRGYVGPQGLEKVRYIADPRVAPARPGSPAQTRSTRMRRTSSPAVTSRSTTTSTSSWSRRATPAPPAARASGSTAPSRSATSSSSAASTPTPSSSTSSARRASRSASPWAPTASASPAPSPPSPSRRPTSRACAGPRRSPRPTSTWSPRARPCRPSWRSTSPRSWARPVYGCWWTTVRASRPA